MSNLSGVKAAEIYCFMRDMGNDHQPSWEAAYAVIRSQQGGMFEISPDHAAVLITEAVVTDPGSFPSNSVQYLDDLFGGSIGASESLNGVLHSTDSSDSNSFNSTNSTDDEKLISAMGNAVTFDNQGIYDVINPDKPDQNSVVDQIETTIDQPQTPDYIVVPDFNNPVPEMPSPEFKSFDSLTNPAPRFGDNNWERMDELLMERDIMLEIAKMLEERVLLERRLSLANGQVNEQPTSDNAINSNAFANKPDVEFADDPLTNFYANANEFTGGDGLNIVGHASVGSITAEPITDIAELPLGQAITIEESGMDGLVAAGPFDAVTLNEPQNNNVF